MYKVAILGTGFIANQKHLPAWRRMNGAAKLVALCDVDAQRGQQIAREFGISKAYRDTGEMLEKEHPDIVDICTPPKTHAPLAISALEAGAHVLIEKPMAVSPEECDTMLKAADRASRKVCVAHSDLFYPAFRKMRELVRAGKIGEFRGMRIFLSTPVDYITSKPDHWAHRLPGGVIGETGPHIVYLALAFLQRISEVSVHARKLLSEYPWSPFEDYRLEFIGERATCSATLTYATRHWAAEVEVWGTDGMVRADLESQCIVVHRRKQLKPVTVALSAASQMAHPWRDLAATTAGVLTGRTLSTHGLLIREFIRSLDRGAPPPVSGEDGREAIRVMNMIVQQLPAAGA
jgi:predicted dehydrogenase